MKLLRYLPFLAVACGFVAFFAFGLQDYVNLKTLAAHRQDLLQFVADNRLLSVVIYMSLYIVLVAFTIPGGTVLTLSGGFFFGLWLGGPITIIAATIGASGIFLAARTAFADTLRAKAGKSLEKLQDGFQENAFGYLLFLRLLPVFPFWLLNIAPAFLGVTLRTYVSATFLGIIPGTMIYVWLGTGLGKVLDNNPDPQISDLAGPELLYPLLAFAGLAALPILHKWWQKRKS